MEGNVTHSSSDDHSERIKSTTGREVRTSDSSRGRAEHVTLSPVSILNQSFIF